MKHLKLLPLLLTTVLFCFSCTDEDKDDHGGRNYYFDASFRKADLTGARSLVLASSEAAASSASHSAVRTKGEGNGNNNQHTDYNYSAPLYKVSADGTMVEVGYEVEVVTSSGSGKDDEQKIRDSISTHLTLKIEYIYGINDKWLMLYNCSYDYPGYDELPDGNLKTAISNLINNGNNRNRNYLVRLEDGALFMFERDQNPPILGRTSPHSQNEVKGAVEMIGSDIYFLDWSLRLALLKDRGNTVDISYVLNNTIYSNYILSTGSVMGIVPSFSTGTSMINGRPSVVFPGSNTYVAVNGTNPDDKDTQLFMVDNVLYVARNEGYQLEEKEFDDADCYLIINNEEFRMKMPDTDWNDDTKGCLFNVYVEAGSKIGFKNKKGKTLKVHFREFETTGSFSFGIDNPSDIAYSTMPDAVIDSTGYYEFYVQVWDNSGEMEVLPEGANAKAGFELPFGIDRYKRGEKSSVYKVEISGNSVSLGEKPIVSYFGNTPRFSYMEGDYETRSRRIITGGVVSWLEEKNETTLLNRVDLNKAEYSLIELPGHFPNRMSEYYDGMAYVSKGNTGYYECSLATAQERYVEFDLTALNQYSLSTQLTDAVFDPSIKALTMMAFLHDGTKLTVYVDVEGENAGKARVFTTAASGAGMVISSLVRLN